MEQKDEVLLLPGEAGGSSFNPWSHLWNQYWWVLVVLAALSLTFVIPETVKSGAIESAQIERPWNDDEDPVIVGHVTDVHINAIEPEDNYQLRLALENYGRWNLDQLVITGDLVDNWGDRTFGQYGHQYLPDFEMYKSITDKFYEKMKHVIELAGNHDVFGLHEYDSPNNHFLKYTRFFSRSPGSRIQEFWASPIEIHDAIVVALNPHRFPTPHAKFDFWVRQTSEILDFVESALKKAQEMARKSDGRTKPIIVACHYPMKFWIMRNMVSSSGLTFEQIMENSGAALYISGHVHPTHVQYAHHRGFLEVVGQDLKEHAGYSFITIDNGRPYHHTYKITEVPPVILTHPLPAQLLTKNVPFCEKSTAIRLIAMNDSLNIQVKGVVEGKMKCIRRLKNGAYLYSYPLEKLENGFHTIEFDGDWKGEVDFYVGTQLRSFLEEEYAPVKSLIIVYVILVVVVCLNILILLPCQSVVHIELTDRIQMLPGWLRGILIFGLFAPFVVPIAFVNIEGHLGFTFWYGYYADFTFIYDMWGQIICMVYEAGVVLSSALFAASMAIWTPWHPIFFLDILASFGGLFGSIIYVSKGLIESSGHTLAALSPMFVLMPLFLYSSILFCRFRCPPQFFCGPRAETKKDDKKKVD